MPDPGLTPVCRLRPGSCKARFWGERIHSVSMSERCEYVKKKNLYEKKINYFLLLFSISHFLRPTALNALTENTIEFMQQESYTERSSRMLIMYDIVMRSVTWETFLYASNARARASRCRKILCLQVF